MLLVARHLAEGAGMPVGQKNRIIAEAGCSAWRPYQRAVDAALELFRVAVRPGHAQRAHEMRLALVGPHGAVAAELVLDPAHGGSKILGLARPARRVNPRSAAERIDREAGIIRKGGT